MKHGTICLAPIYKFVHDHPDFYDFSRRPKLDGYAEVVNEIVFTVPDLRGVYVWGHYDRQRYWHSLYLGLAGLGKKGKYRLHSRLQEELKDERSCFWRVCRPEKHIVEARPDGQSARKRAVRKAGSTHILWVATDHLADIAVRSLEAELIEALSPPANRIHPFPPSEIRTKATRIYNAIRTEIHQGRDTKCPVTLK